MDTSNNTVEKITSCALPAEETFMDHATKHPNCINCDENHIATHKGCTYFTLNRNINKLVAERGISAYKAKTSLKEIQKEYQGPQEEPSAWPIMQAPRNNWNCTSNHPFTARTNHNQQSYSSTKNPLYHNRNISDE